MLHDNHTHNINLPSHNNLSANSEIYSFSIPGDPIPKMTHRHGKGRTWNPQKQMMVNYQLLILNQHKNRPWLIGPLHLEAVFYIEPAKSFSQKKKEQLYGKYVDIKPDNSNLCKYIEDLCNGILYKDDCIIASSSYKKIYAKTPRTEFSLVKLFG